ncbi:MAG: hypothetical protein LBV71_04440 [Prevotella sp.]|jgi:hypothetical protein|nr:hypothetical protein [Prevotella sp.]
MKLFNIYIGIICCIFAAGCSNDDKYAEIEELKILRSDVIFDANGGSNTIEIANVSGNALTAQSEDEWCTVNVSGNAVNVNVSPNNLLMGRSTRVHITDGSRSVSVPVTQTAGVFGILDNKDELLFSLKGGSDKLTIDFHTLPVTVEGTPDWLSYQIDEIDGDITIIFTAAPSSKPRMENIVVKSGAVSITIAAKQSVIPYESYIGTYKMEYQDDTFTSASSVWVIEEKEAGKNYTVTCEAMDLPFQLDYDETDGTILVHPQKMGRGSYFNFNSFEFEEDDFYLGLWGLVNMTSPTIEPGAAYKGAWTGSDEFEIAFTDGGGWDYPLEMINFVYIEDETGNYGNDYYNANGGAMYTDIVITKQ